MFTLKLKAEYLIKHHDVTLKPGVNKFTVACEFCGRRIGGEADCFKTGNPKKLYIDGMFHHKDGDNQNDDIGNMQVLDKVCYQRLHDVGVIQRWLDKIGKTVEDLPDCRLHDPIRRG